MNTAMAFRPTRAMRFWRWLGFRHAHVGKSAGSPDLPFPERGWLTTGATFRLPFVERIRVLLSGRISVEAQIITEPAVIETRGTFFDAGTLAPRWRAGPER